MNSGVRIVKQGRDDGSKSLPVSQDEKAAKSCEREIVSTVKSWIAELEQRRRLAAREVPVRSRLTTIEVYPNAADRGGKNHPIS